MKNPIVGLLCAFVLACVAAPLSFAQTGLGAITGHVTDPQGKLIAGANVLATNQTTNAQVATVTTTAGVFELLNLTLGSYTIDVTAPGFEKLEQKDILIQIDDRIGLELSLKIGSVSETVEVTAAVPQLNTENATTGEVVNNVFIETLPQTNRDPLALITIAGNVSGGGGRAGIDLGPTGSFSSPGNDTRINGGRENALEYYVDGSPISYGLGHNIAPDTPRVEDVSELKIVTNGLGAEYGRLSGGAVEIVTQSGNNAYHGQIFNYDQNAFFNAKTWGNDAPKPHSIHNDFGGTVGGPVVLPKIYDGHNKTFFFFNYEGVRQHSANLQIYSFPNAAERGNPDSNGIPTTDFNLGDIGLNPGGTPPMMYDPYGPVTNYSTPITTPAGPATWQRNSLLPGNGTIVPLNYANPTAIEYLKYLPLPNHDPLPGTGLENDYYYTQPDKISDNTWSLRLDQNLGDKSHLFFRFTHERFDNAGGLSVPTLLGNLNTTYLPGGWSTSLHYDRSISPTLILSLRASTNYSPFVQGSELNPQFTSNAAFGYDPEVIALIGTKNILGADWAGPTQNFNQDNDPVQRAGGTGLLDSTSFVYAASLTKILSRHSIKFGYEGRRYYDNYSNQPGAQASPVNPELWASGTTDGQYNIDQQWTSQGLANGLGAFIMGQDQWTQSAGPIGRSMAFNYYSSFLQDDFKVNSKLVLYLGVRWETESPLTERHNRIPFWDPKLPSPFTVNPGYSWSAALAAATPALTPAQIASIPEPYWAITGQFLPGGLVLPGTPEHPGRNLTAWHPWNFAPRLGVAYRIENNTVIRASFSGLYVPSLGNIATGGDIPGVAYTDTAQNNSTQCGKPPLELERCGFPNGGTQFFGGGPAFLPGATPPPNAANFATGSIFLPSQITSLQHSTYAVNQQAAGAGSGTGGLYYNTHMPIEWDYSVGIQQQLPNKFLLEVTYNGNYSNTLLAGANVSQFPKSLYTGGPNGQNALIYEHTQIPSPLAPGAGNPQIPNGGYAGGSTAAIGILQYLYPYFGQTYVGYQNIGLANYQGLNFRVQRNFANGLQFLLNYTLSKSLDDVGGGASYNTPSGGANGFGSKSYQSVDGIRAAYGLSPFDQTHRVSATYNYQFPLGRGRRWMSNVDTVGEKVLDGFVGGWEFSGQTIYRSGEPIVFNWQNNQVDQGIGIWNTFGSVTGLPILNPGFEGPRSVQYNSAQLPPTNGAFNKAGFTNDGVGDFGLAASFTYGTGPVVFGQFREPSNWTTDMSIMKSFPVFSSDGSRYLQLRLEASNIFNHPGYGNYDVTPNDVSFGTINGPANSPRFMVISARFVF
jgi:hypothetical protein